MGRDGPKKERGREVRPTSKRYQERKLGEEKRKTEKEEVDKIQFKGEA